MFEDEILDVTKGPRGRLGERKGKTHEEVGVLLPVSTLQTSCRFLTLHRGGGPMVVVARPDTC